jgi:hypothetical protein
MLHTITGDAHCECEVVDALEDALPVVGKHVKRAIREKG